MVMDDFGYLVSVRQPVQGRLQRDGDLADRRSHRNPVLHPPAGDRADHQEDGWMKIVIRLLMLVMAFLPSLALADIASGPSVSRLHRIGYEVSLDSRDAHVKPKDQSAKSIAESGSSRSFCWVLAVMALGGVAICFCVWFGRKKKGCLLCCVFGTGALIALLIIIYRDSGLSLLLCAVCGDVQVANSVDVDGIRADDIPSSERGQWFSRMLDIQPIIMERFEERGINPHFAKRDEILSVVSSSALLGKKCHGIPLELIERVVHHPHEPSFWYWTGVEYSGSPRKPGWDDYDNRHLSVKDKDRRQKHRNR